jgi:hypothetical protein
MLLCYNISWLGRGRVGILLPPKGTLHWSSKVFVPSA